MTSTAALLCAGFGLRLALGLIAALYLLPRHEVSPRFYRTQFLIVLGLLTASALGGWSHPPLDDSLPLLLSAIVLSFVGSILWNIEGAPGGHALIVLITLPLMYLSWIDSQAGMGPVESVSSAGVLGLTLSAMLMGHSYLIAPAMSLTPLRRLLIGLFVAVAVRMLLAGLACWTAGRSLASLPVEALIWLALRWGIGFGGTLLLAGLAWRCARIRSTQSATGILYVVVLFAFMGELIGQLLRQSGYN